MSKKLEHCPHCKSEIDCGEHYICTNPLSLSEHSEHYFQAVCPSCGMSGPQETTRKKSRKAWNALCRKLAAEKPENRIPVIWVVGDVDDQGQNEVYDLGGAVIKWRVDNYNAVGESDAVYSYLDNASISPQIHAIIKKNNIPILRTRRELDVFLQAHVAADCIMQGLQSMILTGKTK